MVCLGCLASATDVGATTPAERETARQLMAAGDRARDAGDMSSAAENYRKADALVGVPTTALALGRAEMAQGRWVEALDAFGRARRFPVKDDTPAVLVRAKNEATRLDAELAPRVPTLTLQPQKELRAEALISVDGVPFGPLEAVPLRLNPGPHELEITADGYLTNTLRVELEEGAHVTRRLLLERDPSAEEPPSPEAGASMIQPWTVAGLASGGAALVVAGITGGIAWQRTGNLRDECGGSVCPEAERDRHDGIITLSNVSNAMWAVGGLITAAGIASLVVDLVAVEHKEDVAIVPLVAPTVGGLSIAGAF